jgi:1,4-dihydroxy-6-naphthoate synthase
LPFDEIFDAVKSGAARMVGLIIHEGQLTYAGEESGVHSRPRSLVERSKRNCPLPLGGNVIRKDIAAGWILFG